MESFSLTGVAGWQRLSTLLAADPTFQGWFLWTMFGVKNTGGGVVIVKSQPGQAAPSTTSGISLAGGIGFVWDAGNQGIIDGKAIWINGAGPIDISFIRKTGLH